MRGESDRWTEEGGARIRIVDRANVVAISVMRPGAAAYDCTRCWLEGDTTLHDPQARALRRHFANRHHAIAQASASAFAFLYTQ
jgi:hypothetical protein